MKIALGVEGCPRERIEGANPQDPFKFCPSCLFKRGIVVRSLFQSSLRFSSMIILMSCEI